MASPPWSMVAPSLVQEPRGAHQGSRKSCCEERGLPALTKYRGSDDRGKRSGHTQQGLPEENPYIHHASASSGIRLGLDPVCHFSKTIPSFCRQNISSPDFISDGRDREPGPSAPRRRCFLYHSCFNNYIAEMLCSDLHGQVVGQGRLVHAGCYGWSHSSLASSHH